MRLRARHVRTRLTLWYVSVLAALLVVGWAGTCALLFFQLRNQLDHLSIQEIETVEGLFYFTPDGQLHLHEEYHNHPESKNVIERYVEVRSPEGALLFRNARLGGRTLEGRPYADEGVGGYSPRTVRLADGSHARVVSRRHVLDGRTLVIRLAHSEEPLYAQIRALLLALLVVVPVVLGGAGFAGYVLARRALQPVEEMACRAREITPEHLDARLPNDAADDELGQLARVFNQTLERLEDAFEQLRRFTSDASHELRTPLAMIRSVGEVGLQKDGTREDYRDTIGSMLEEVNRLTELIENLLTISRADSGNIHLHREPLPLMELAREAAGLFEVLAEEKSLRIVLQGSEQVEVDADRLVLRQALVNIIHNAVKYSPVRDEIVITVGPGASVAVADHGPGIPPEDQAKVFTRFYRVDKARWRESGGTGLGLSIAKWAVEAHGGSIALESGGSGGCTFRIGLPA